MRWEIRSLADDRVARLDAPDWMMALSKAVAKWDMPVHGWTCSTRKNGEVWVHDPTSGLSWVVAPLSAGVPRRRSRADTGGPELAPPPPPGGLGRSLKAPGGSDSPSATTSIDPSDAPPLPANLRGRPVAVPGDAPAPRLRMPTEGPKDPTYGPGGEWAPDQDEFDPLMSIDPIDEVEPTIARELPEELRVVMPGPENLAERLFDMADQVAASPTAYEACELVLDLCVREIGCEAGSVLRGNLNDQALTFVACAGPAADALVGRKLRFGRGLVGFSFDQGFTVVVNDVDNDERHLSAVDQETGFRTVNVLCAPVRTEVEHYGVLQLLNADGGFKSWHVEVAESLSKSLAAALAAGLH